jgi:hypothetical protein
MTSIPRGWFAFRLRSLLTLVAVLSVALGWVGYSLNWIRQRHKAMDAYCVFPIWRPIRAPGGLGLLGETGKSTVPIIVDDRAEFARLTALFPESQGITLLERK